MPRNNKRQTRRSVPAAAAAVTINKPAAVSARTPEREFNPDYTPVIKDLKRIGTLAGTFFVVLVVLSFILK